jgi:3-phenylpropionate/trans-cinnamate dioxygenase ferredoxin reductase subunit
MLDGPIVIIGAGHAGVSVAARLAELGRRDDTVLLGDEDSAPYERPPLSKEMLDLGNPFAGTLLRPERFYAEKGIELLTGQRVTSIDRATRQINLGRGRRLRYGTLVIATGSEPRRLNVPGAHLPGVHMLRTASDARRIRESLLSGGRLVIAGAGYIGLEVAAAGVKAGCAVTVMEAQDRVMARVTSKPVSDFFEKLHRAAGVRLDLGATIGAFEGTDHVKRVVTTGGEVHPADSVVVGVGALPCQWLAQDAGVACDDGILVDRVNRTSDVDIYAVGDVSRTTGPHSVRLESVQGALAQAIAAADHIVTGAVTAPEVPWFWTDQHGVRLQTAGVRAPTDELVLRGDPSEGRFSVLYLRQGRLAAIDTVGSLKDFIPGRKLIEAGARLNPGLAADPSVKLTQALDLVSQQDRGRS